MRDQHIRAAFHQTVLQTAHQDSYTQVIDELGLKNGDIRADIAVFNGKMVGYEIKTDKDNLLRFSAQAAAYSEVFDNAYVISGARHLKKVMKMIPEWWGVFSIQINEENVISFQSERTAQVNPQQNAYTIAQLLWKDEVIALLQEKHPGKVRTSYTKHRLYLLLVQQFSLEELSQAVLNIVKRRAGWRTNLLPLL